jgi:hypothetical protein
VSPAYDDVERLTPAVQPHPPVIALTIDPPLDGARLRWSRQLAAHLRRQLRAVQPDLERDVVVEPARLHLPVPHGCEHALAAAVRGLLLGRPGPVSDYIAGVVHLLAHSALLDPLTRALSDAVVGAAGLIEAGCCVPADDLHTVRRDVTLARLELAALTSCTGLTVADLDTYTQLVEAVEAIVALVTDGRADEAAAFNRHMAELVIAVGWTEEPLS